MQFPFGRRGGWLAWGRLMFAVILLGLPGRGLGAANAALPDYIINVWNTEDNLPGSTVTAIAQTPDGYLWVGTYEGLARFDGVRFVTFDPLNTPALSHARIQGLYVDARGTLWINTFRGGLTSYRDGVFRREWPDQNLFDLHTVMARSSSNRVVFVTQFGQVLQRSLAATNSDWKVLTPPAEMRPLFQCADHEGHLWFLSREGRIIRVLNGQYEPLPDDGGLGTNRVYTLAADAAGRVWAGAEDEIARWDGHRFENMTPTNSAPGEMLEPTMVFPTAKGPIWVLANERLREAVGRRWVAEAVHWRGLLGPASGRGMGAHEDRAGGVWFNHYGNGVFHITPDGQFQRLTLRTGLPGDRVGAWFQGRDNGIWLGVDRGGLVRLRERRFQVIGWSEGLPARTALSVCQGRDGTVWIGTSGGGLCAWREGKLTVHPVGQTASSDFVFSIYPQSDDGLWLSAGEGEDLFQFRDGKLERAPWEVHGVKSLLTDHAGRLWVGTKANVGWYSATERRVFGQGDGLTLSAVRTLAETPDGTVWCGADDGTLYRCGLTNVQAFRPDDLLGSHPIWSLLADQDGTLWVGTFRGGLLRFKDGKFARFTSRQGLPVDVISQMLEDDRGRLWLGTHQGICCVAKSALNACADGKAGSVDVVQYLDGLPTLECSDGYQPACWRAGDGRLWFTTVNGVVSVNPDALTSRSPPPPVVIEELRVDGESFPVQNGKVVVPPGHKQYEFRFTALSFDAPEKARFRYRIDGLDTKWVEADTRRTAHYGHLAPHPYRFRVIACNSDGVWNTTGATLEFTVRPYFYETAWFLVLVSVLILGAVAAGVRAAAARKYRRALNRLAQQHAIERDRARIAKDIHDDIGAGLTQITLLSELARREPAQAAVQLDRIADAARDLTRAMDEIVWAVDPQHDTFTGLMDYISAFAEDFLRTAGIRCRMDLPTTLPEMRVDAELRYNLFLAVKEALNNVVKHAHASEVRLRLHLDSNCFTLVVEDNGLGLKAATPETTTIGAERLSSGSGISNLKRRLEAIGGRCEVKSAAGRGTRVEMTVGMDGAASPVVAIGPDATGG